MAQNRDSVSVANGPGDTLHARLLVEIERREEPRREQLERMGTKWGRDVVGRELAYLEALRAITDMHRNAGGGCHECEYDWPCATLRCVAEGLGVTP